MNVRTIALAIAAAFAVACSPGANPPPASASQPAAAPAAAPPPTAAPVTPAAAATATPATPAAADAKPQFREVTIPSGTSISVKLASAVASDTSKVEDAVRGTLAKPIVVDGETVVPSGADVSGSVLEAKQSGRVKGLASVAIRFDRLKVGSEGHVIRTARIAREAKPTKQEDAKKVGI